MPPVDFVNSTRLSRIAGVADDEPARFEHELAAGLLHGRQDHLRERTRGQRLVLAVVDAEAAAHVEVADVVPLLAERLDQLDRLLGALPVRLGLQDRRAEVHVQPDDRETRVADDRLRDVDDRLDVEPELHALHGCVGLDVRLRRQVRVHAERDAGLAAVRLRDLADGVQFLLALDVEEEDAVFEGVADLGVGLADAREDDLRAGRPGLERAEELAAARSRRTRAVLAHQPADAEVAVGLHASSR